MDNFINNVAPTTSYPQTLIDKFRYPKLNEKTLEDTQIEESTWGKSVVDVDKIYEALDNLGISTMVNRISQLEEEVEALTKLVKEQSLGVKTIPLSNLRSEKLALSSPINITLDSTSEIVIANSYDLNIFGYGNNEIEAIRDFCNTLEDFYFLLDKDKDKLPKEQSVIYNFLNKIIKNVSKN
ncbi:hypothetical protein KKA15_06765 [Patescibacteria group bacterium]|nr:hypothetical protein [Patescibacteria group bacterium]